MSYFKMYEKGDENRIDLINYKLIDEVWLRLSKLIENYHNYEVKNIENLLKLKEGIVIFNHGFLAYDVYLLILKYYLKNKKIIRGLTDHIVFKVPVLRELFLAMGIVDGINENASKLIENNEMIFILPGGAREAMKSSKEKYKLKWQGRYGFLKLALKYNIPVIPIASIGIDDVFDVYVDGYEFASLLGLKDIPLPIFSGRYGLPIPKPVKITHYVGEPVYFSKEETELQNDKLNIRMLQRKIKKIMENMIEKGLKEQKENGTS